MQLNVVRLDINLSLASRAVEEVPGYTWRGPSAEHALFDALDVENVLAAENDRGLVSEPTDHADAAVVRCGIVLVELEVDELLVVCLDTLWIEAGQATFLTTEAETLVATRMRLVATSLHFFNALR